MVLYLKNRPRGNREYLVNIVQSLRERCKLGEIKNKERLQPRFMYIHEETIIVIIMYRKYKSLWLLYTIFTIYSFYRRLLNKT